MGPQLRREERFEEFIQPFLAEFPDDEILIDTRPREGDLVYFPLGQRIFEIKRVEHEQPFYQLGTNYTYKLECELFQYEGEAIDTTIEEIDKVIQAYGYTTELTLVGAGTTAELRIDNFGRTGTIQKIVLTNDGSGYTQAPTVSISTSPALLPGSTAQAVAITTNKSGVYSVDRILITNPGFGYTTSNPPLVLAPTPNVSYENILEIDTVEGFSGIVTGISTTSGTAGNPLAIQFFLNSSSFTGLTTGYPIHIFGTGVGSGVTSIDDSNSAVVGVGTTFCDNIYIIHTFNNPGGSNADIIVNVDSGTDVTGLSTTGSTTLPVGRFSWGRLSGFTRADSPISIGVTGLTIDSGLSTFPTIQRRGYGLRNGGSLRKDLG